MINNLNCQLEFTLTYKALILLGFIFAFQFHLFSQQAEKIDSLSDAYQRQQHSDSERLSILKRLSFAHYDPEKAVMFSDELIKLATELDSTSYIYLGYLHRGNAFIITGDHGDALESYFKAAEIANKTESSDRLGRVNLAIADAYSVMGDHKNAARFYNISINIFKDISDDEKLAIAYENLGDEYLNVSKPDSALIMFNKSGPVFKRLGFNEGIAMNIGNKGMAYAMLGQDNLAKEEINHAINMFESMGGYSNVISAFLTYISDIYLDQGNSGLALEYSIKSLNLANKYGLKSQISDANLQLSKIYEVLGDDAKSLDHYKNYTTYKDSVNNISSVQQIANIRADFEISQKQLEVDLLSEQKRNQTIVVIAISIALALIIVLAIGLFRRNNYIEKTKVLIENEKNRSDKLLLNILPEKTAEELKEHGKVSAKKFETVSVMFTDFKGFTKLSENLSPEELVQSVDFYYSKFDEIIRSYGLEKIKTIGDSYMAAAGLPFPEPDHATKLVSAALDILAFVKQAEEDNPNNEQRFKIRIGINTGPVVAGVVGTDKFAYDIWGDTVNIASRMESSSEPGKINISHSTFELVKDQFNHVYRGEIKAKNRGAMKMYFIESIKTSENTREKIS